MYVTSTLVLVLHVAGSGGNGGTAQARGLQRGSKGRPGAREQQAGRRVTVPWAGHSNKARAPPEGNGHLQQAQEAWAPGLHPSPADPGVCKSVGLAGSADAWRQPRKRHRAQGPGAPRKAAHPAAWIGQTRCAEKPGAHRDMSSSQAPGWPLRSDTRPRPTRPL